MKKEIKRPTQQYRGKSGQEKQDEFTAILPLGEKHSEGLGLGT